MKIAIVHDWLNQEGGAEDVLRSLVRLFPDAPIFTSIYDPRRMQPDMQAWDVRVTWLNRIPGIYARHRPFLPLYPLAFDSMKLGDYDLVLSNKSGFCHGIHPGRALHLCYCLTPTRYVWTFDDYAAAEGMGWARRLALKPLIGVLKGWDRSAAERVHQFVAISTEIQARIMRYYRRESVVIYPPVDTRRFSIAAEPEDYYLCLGRLIPYKRVDLAVHACTALGRKLRVGGSGRDRARLEAAAGPSVQFLGWVASEHVPGLVARCRAFIFPGLEDFGIAPVQAMAAGRPVIAYAGGGSMDTVVDGVTGVLFREPTAASLQDAIRRFESMSFDPDVIRRHAAQFDVSVFEKNFAAYVSEQFSRYGGQPRVHSATSRT